MMDYDEPRHAPSVRLDGAGIDCDADPCSRLVARDAHLANAVILQTVQDLLYRHTAPGARASAERFVLSGNIKPWLATADEGHVTSRYDSLCALAKASRGKRDQRLHTAVMAVAA